MASYLAKVTVDQFVSNTPDQFSVKVIPQTQEALLYTERSTVSGGKPDAGQI